MWTRRSALAGAIAGSVGVLALDKATAAPVARASWQGIGLTSVTLVNVTLPAARAAGAANVHVLGVLVRDQAGNEGFGYSYFLTAQDMDGATSAAAQLAAAAGGRLLQLLDIEASEAVAPARGTLRHSRAAAAAISLAAWDLAGRRNRTSCASMWGNPATRIDCYASDMFADSPSGSAAELARRYRKAGFRKVKALVGLDQPANAAARVTRLQSVFPGAGNVVADAHRRWTPDQVRDFLSRLKTPLLWMEDATPYDRLSELAVETPLGAGEYATNVEELAQLVEAGVSRLLIDVGLIGGPMRFLHAARRFGALGVKIGSHVYGYYSAHLLGALADHLPCEVLNWWDPLFVDPPRPDGKGMLPVSGPGFGLRINHALLQAQGRFIPVAA